MRVPLGWLRDYVDVDLAPEALAERLTLLGMEVRAIERFGADWRNVVVGELLTVAKHPRADRLSLTTVRVGDGEVLEIVCGATNIAAGQRVPVALPGAVLPGDRRIERTEKMGVVSNGMLCSGDELGLTADADGILILPTRTEIGARLTDLYGDDVLDVDVKPNRGDALSLIGLAREVSAATGAPVRMPPTTPPSSGRSVKDRLHVEIREPELCSRFVGRWVSDVRVAPSPDLVQMRLQAAGMRPISNVVDASNYVMLELGKPTHTFDAAAIRDGKIIVRLATAGERLETLDHVTRELTPDTLVIADLDGPVGIAGVMGGASSEISATTRDVVIESAIFDPVSIRRTGQRYALRSEASLRFEKGQEHALARVGADRVALLLADWGGGEVAPDVVDTDPSGKPAVRVAYRPDRVNRLLGTELTPEEQGALLARVGVASERAPAGTRIVVAGGTKPLAVDSAGAPTMLATVPPWRRDIAIEADVAEEIARVRGYELVPGTTPDTPMPVYRSNQLEVRDAVRELLAGAGISETVTHALVSPRLEELLRWAGDPTGEILPAVPGDGPAGGAPIIVTNPLSRDHSVLRRELIGSLLSVVDENLRHGRDDIAVFEVGKGYARSPEAKGRSGDDGPATREWWRLGVVLVGASAPRSWNRPDRAWDLDDAKGLVELIATRLGFGAPRYRPATDGYPFHPGRSAWVTATAVAGDRDSGQVVLAGRVAELHPEAIETLELRTDRVVAFELAVRGLGGGSLPTVRAGALSNFPAVERDIAVVVSTSAAVGDAAESIQRHGGQYLRAVRLFDIYRGAPLDDADQSLAFRLTFQAPDRTLEDADLDAAMTAVRDGLRTEVSARFRE